MSDPIDVVRRVIACDNGRDAEGYRALLHDAYRSFVHGNPSTVGPEQEVAALQMWWQACSDVHLEPLALFASEGVVTLRYTLEGTNDGPLGGEPATGRRFRIENCTLLEVDGDLVRTAWRFSDTFGLMTQLGRLPSA
ncbi:MAG: ester cyclase [Gammaproteobacteria bacterium]|nr:ester cyclase [Gammaproteobacteria bacterium]